jgi:hypothetical protein
MPTGYTECISKGVSFEKFVMTCARAFGACIEMRDDSLSVPIPEEFKPSTYHIDALATAQTELEHLSTVTIDGAEWRANVEYNHLVAERNEYIKKNVELLQKYNDMLFKVGAWQPPTPDHIELKKFMLQQLKESMKFDSMLNYYDENPVKKLSGKE